MFRSAGLIILLLISFTSHAQIGMQQWRIHFSSFNTIGIAQTDEGVFMAAKNGIVEYNKSDNSISTMTVINGMSDLGASVIRGNAGTLVIGYENGNLDILEDGIVTNIPFIKTAEIAGSKRIKNVSFYNDLIFVSTEIGLVVVNNTRKEIKDTYYPYENPVVNDAVVSNDTLYVATEQGLYKAQVDAPFLNNKDNWTKHTNLPSGIVDGPFSDVRDFNGTLVLAYSVNSFDSDSIYFLNGGTITPYEHNPVELIGLSIEDNMYISRLSSIDIVAPDFTRSDIIYQYPMGIPQPRDAVFYNGEYWIADKNFGMVKAINSFAAESVFTNSPFADGSYRMDIQFGKLVVAGGGLTSNLVNTFSNSGIYIFEEEEWTSMNGITHPDNIVFTQDFDFVSAAVNPNNTNEFAFASNSKGGIKWVKEGTTIAEELTPLNSILEYTGTDNIIVPDMKFDRNGNLWVVNQGLDPLKVFCPDGSSYAYSLGSSAKNRYPYRLTIDSQGRKWISIIGVGLAVFDDAGTLDDTSDDQLQMMTTATGSGDLPSTFIKAVAQDIDGEIWIGTEEGLVVLYNTSQIFDGGFGDYDANSILLDVNGTVEALFGTTHITAIAVDGGNRKWIGTSASGVICVSEDGLEEIYRFTAENSPLISNNILDIKIDHASGEIYFATEQGLVSFRADGTIGDEEFESVDVFPNPVRPEYTGPITIQGIGFESDVRITDVSGNLVFKTMSNGGTVIWDGKTLEGERVQSGVYLVWATSTGGKGKKVAKILFIN